MTGELLLVLHAHLPWVKGSKAERWLFEATLGCYLPLLQVLTEHPGCVALSVSPTLSSMWRDAELTERTEQYLEQAAAKPIVEGHEAASQWHRERARVALNAYRAVARDLCAAFVGKAELFTTAATHGFLPLLAQVPEAAAAQVAVGLSTHAEHFGQPPRGFWLPECAYSPALEPLLAERHVRWFCVESHAVAGAVFGVHQHVFTPMGLAAFARDPSASEQVWSASIGYPSNPVYAEFHHRTSGQRVQSVGGLRWQPEEAFAQARADAAHFWAARERAAMAGAAVQVAPYDAELFGHWWLEGPEFLRAVLASKGSALRFATPSQHLAHTTTAQRWQLPFSSWGRGGAADVWLNEKNADLWPQLQRAAELMVALAERPADVHLRRRARALLLAQASDWPFLIDGDAEAGFARARVEEQLLRVYDEQPMPADETLFGRLDPSVFRRRSAS